MGRKANIVVNNSKVYFKNLDATRFIAFLAVFLEHIVVTNNPSIQHSSLYSFYSAHFHLAAIGVGFFIVLSGFLISWIILEEYKNTSAFNLPFFWLRRTLRIWPLYFLMIIIAYIIVWATENFTGIIPHHLPPVMWLLTFTLNFYIVQHGQAFLFFLVFLWSISIEEQCYIVWGIVLKWLKNLFIPFCVTMLLLSISFKIYALHDYTNLYFNTLSWIGYFATGALLANFCMKGGKLFERLRKISKPVIAAIYMLFLCWMVLFNHLVFPGTMAAFEPLLLSLFFAFIIFEQSFCVNNLFEPGKSPILSYSGKISYGLFCYHGLIILLFTQLTGRLGWQNNSILVFFISPLIIFALSFLVSAFSYHYFEKPIMRLRNKVKPA